MKLFKGLGAEDIAIRLTVRTLIKQNIVAVNAFMESSFGRIVVFAYNVNINYKIIAANEAQVDFAKQKISLLDKTIKDFETKTTFSPIPFIQKILATVLPTEALASVEIPNRSFKVPNPPCMRDILPKCSVKDLIIIPSDKNEIHMLENSPSFTSAMSLATGKLSYDDIDLVKIKSEVKMLEEKYRQIEKERPLPKDNQFVAHKDQLIKQWSEENFFPKEVIASISTPVPFEAALEKIKKKDFKPDTLDHLEDEIDSPAATSKMVESSNQNGGQQIVKAATMPQNDFDRELKKSVDNYEIDVKAISSKELDIFQIITNRYHQIYFRNELNE